MPTDFILFSYRQLKCSLKQKTYLLPNQRLTYKPGYRKAEISHTSQLHVTMEVILFWCTQDKKVHVKSKPINRPVTLTRLVTSLIFGYTS